MDLWCSNSMPLYVRLSNAGQLIKVRSSAKCMRYSSKFPGLRIKSYSSLFNERISPNNEMKLIFSWFFIQEISVISYEDCAASDA